MAGASVRITGLDKATRLFTQLRDSAGRFSGYTAEITSDMPYAAAIETGHFKDGRKAREAGPAHYMKGAVDSATAGGKIPERLVKAIPEGPQAVTREFRAINEDIAEDAARRAPVVSGALRDSIQPSRTGI